MGKIKSARELALERAAALTGNVDSSDKTHEYDQYIKAAVMLAGSYLDGKTTLERLVESIGGYPAVAAPAAKKGLLKQITAGLNLDNCEAVLAAYRAFRPELSPNDALEALTSLHREYTKRRAVLQAELEQGGGLKLLKDKGISGSAVAGINPERFPQWQEAKEALAEELGDRLQQIKQRLIRQLQS